MYDRIGHLNAVLYAPTKKEQIEAYTEWTSSADYEITRLRARLEKAERERDHALVVQEELIEKGFRKQIYKARDEGFRAGIEAAVKISDEWREAYEKVKDCGGITAVCQIISDDIRALSPTDNTTTVTEAAQKVVDEYEDQTHGPVIYSIDELRDDLAAQKGDE